MKPTSAQAAALRQVLDAILEAVAAAGPMGAPGGVIYAALMGQGCSLSQYQALMGGLVSVHRLRRDGDLYFVVPVPARAAV
jgi:hypothetical protein